jgi:CHAD domain-containing protein
LRAAVRALADVRDRDVGRSLLAKRRVADPHELEIKRRMVGLSESDRRTALARSLRGWPKKLDRLLIDLLEETEPAVEAVIRRARAEAWQHRRNAIDLIQALGRRYLPRRLHELRIRVRRLRYAIEVLGEVDSAAQARVIQLKPLQSALGDTQDRIVLSQWLGRQATRFQKNDPALSAALRREALRFRAESMRAHAAFLRLRPKGLLERLALHVDSSHEHPESAGGLRPHRPRSASKRRSKESRS